MHREESSKSQRSLHVTPDLWSLSIELASFHCPGIWHFEVAPYTSVKFVDPCCQWRLRNSRKWIPKPCSHSSMSIGTTWSKYVAPFWDQNINHWCHRRSYVIPVLSQFNVSFIRLLQFCWKIDLSLSSHIGAGFVNALVVSSFEDFWQELSVRFSYPVRSTCAVQVALLRVIAVLKIRA